MEEHKVYHSLYKPLLFGGVPQRLLVWAIFFNVLPAVILTFIFGGKAIYAIGVIIFITLLFLAKVRKETAKDPKYALMLWHRLKHEKLSSLLKKSTKYWR